MKKMLIKGVLRLLLGLFSVLIFSSSGFGAQEEFYPIIFIHGHGIKVEIEDTWKFMIENLMISNSGGYIFYDPNHDGHIDVLHSESSNQLKTNSISPRTIFSFGYYRVDETTPFGDQWANIGGCPDVYTGGYGGSYYKDQNGQPRASFAKRLGQFIDNVLRATGKDKVNLVCHSMGGLVSRAYIRWIPNGAKKINKILTVGTPNKGIPDDLRLALEQTKVQEWQKSGEEQEMASGRKVFNGKDYTQILNEGWQNFCEKNGVQYATLRGNYNPWSLFRIGDGVVEEDSAQIDGAVFNGLAHMAHLTRDSFYVDLVFFLPDARTLPISAPYFPDEMAMTNSTYVSEVIKRWIIQGQKDESGLVDKVVLANPFENKMTLQYRLNSGSAVSVELLVLDMTASVVASLQAPVYPQQHLISFDVKSLNLPTGVYSVVVTISDVNGTVYSNKFKLAKVVGNGDFPGGPTIRFLNTPSYETTSNVASFKYTYDNNGGSYSYSLDGHPMSTLSTLDSVTLQGLTPGQHVFLVTGYGLPAYMANNAAIITWIVNDRNKKIYQDILTKGRLIEADQSLKTSGNVTIEKGASVIMTSKEIRLTPGFTAKAGSDVTIQARKTK
jgi:pimeloyl-ACP methyl ester carboxylesterase